MSNTPINVKIIDQQIQLTNSPRIASGSEGVLQVHCAFDVLWAGYEVTAVFFRDEKTVYHVPLYLSTATVPHEVMTEEGHFFMGFMGVAENTRTTELIRLEVKKGAITEGVSVPDPTPDVYTQLMQLIHQAGVIPDATLTQAGKAADAKAVGDAIDKVIQDTTQMVGETADDIVAMYPRESDFPGCYYRIVDGEEEWVNPPMMVGVEYRTSERWSGKAVYTKLINFGNLPGANAEKWVAHGCTFTHVLRAHGEADTTCFPRIGTAKFAYIALYVNAESIGVHCETNMSAQMASVQLWYVKD